MANAFETYDKILIANLQRANDFLRFAEAKNAALIALSSAWFVATLNLECSGKTVPSPFTAFMPAAMCFALLTAVSSLISFLPRLKLNAFRGGRRAGPHTKNLLYFGDIASIPIRSLQSEMHRRYYPLKEELTPEYVHDITEQISVNSEIVLRKMKLFGLGAASMFVAVLLLVIPAFEVAFRTMRATW